MNKEDLTKELVSKKGLTKQQAVAAIEGITEAIITSLSFNQPVTLRGFGTFRNVRRARKQGYDIIHKHHVDAPAHNVVKFVPSRQLREIVR